MLSLEINAMQNFLIELMFLGASILYIASAGLWCGVWCCSTPEVKTCLVLSLSDHPVFFEL